MLAKNGDPIGGQGALRKVHHGDHYVRQNEDDSKSEDNPKNEDNLNNEKDPKNRNNLKK